MSLMTTIIKKELRERRTSLVVYSLVGIGAIWLYVAMFPSLQSQAKDLAKILEAMPKEILKAFGAEGTGLENVEGLLASKQFGLVWPILTIVLMLNRAANSLAGEIENGTIGTLLSQPISRAKIFLAKYLAGVITLVTFIFASVLANIPLISAYRLHYSVSGELAFAGVCLLYGLALYGAGMAISAFVSERSKVYSLLGGGIMLMFVLNIVSGLQTSLSGLRYTSLFYYFNAHDMLVLHKVNMVSVALFASIAVVGFITGIMAFTRRDIRI